MYKKCKKKSFLLLNVAGLSPAPHVHIEVYVNSNSNSSTFILTYFDFEMVFKIIIKF